MFSWTVQIYSIPSFPITNRYHVPFHYTLNIENSFVNFNYLPRALNTTQINSTSFQRIRSNTDKKKKEKIFTIIVTFKFTHNAIQITIKTTQKSITTRAQNTSFISAGLAPTTSKSNKQQTKKLLPQNSITTPQKNERNTSEPGSCQDRTGPRRPNRTRGRIKASLT